MSFYSLGVCAKLVDDIQYTSDFKPLVAFHFQGEKKLNSYLYTVCIKIAGIYFRILFIVSRKFSLLHTHLCSYHVIFIN